MVEAVEIMKLLLRAYLALSQVAGLSEEEQAKLYEEEYQKFKNNDPNQLPKLR